MVFLYVGSAEDTVRRPVSRYLAGEEHRHFAIRPDQNRSSLKEELNARAAISGGRAIVIADLRTDTFDESLGPLLDAVEGCGDSLPALTHCEIAADASDPAILEELLRHSLRCANNAIPYFHYYFLVPWSRVGRFDELIENASENEWFCSPHRTVTPIVDFVSVLASALPSRMEPHDGLSFIRTLPRSTAFVCKVRRLTVPGIPDLASLAFQNELLGESLSSSNRAQERSELLGKMRRLIEDYDPAGEGLSGPSAAIKRIHYRDSLLPPLCSILRRIAARPADFITCLDSIIEVVKSRLLGQVLADLRNEIVSIRVRLEAAMAQHRAALNWLDACTHARTQALRLARKWDFPLWPALTSDIRPTAVDVSSDYAEALIGVSNALRTALRTKIRSVEQRGRESFNRCVAQDSGLWNAPRGFVFVGSSLSTDWYDELWHCETEAAALVMLERRLA